MIYLVKRDNGVEVQVTEQIYKTCKGKKEYTCRTLGNEKPEPIKPQTFEKWPKPDEKGNWYTLSNGKRINGKKNAFKAQAELT